MIKLTLHEIATALAINPPTHNITIEGLSRDTRTLVPKNLYVAIKGEQFDGHDFVSAAEEKGASALLLSQPNKSSLPQLIVDDTIQALGKISACWRNRFTLPLIGVTGSCGKTTLKNMIAAILRAACQNNSAEVLATTGNLNNHIGVPLMLSELSSTHRLGVIEMGTNNFGEIAYLTQLVKPKVAIVNNVGPAHLQGLERVEGVARAKGEIFSGLTSDGIAVLNRDDAFFNYFRELIKNHAFLTFGLDNPADVTATESDHANVFQLQTPRGKVDITLPLLGRHNLLNALAATACTLALDIDLAAIKSGLENVAPAPGRMRQHTLNNGLRLIDDTYNANPSSTAAAIHTLSTFPDMKILVLGDMKELGPNAKELHYSIGKQAKNAGIDYLFTFGDLSKNAADAFGDQAEHFVEQEKLVAVVKNFLRPQTTILVKGSRSMKMEKVVANLVATETTSHQSP